MAVRSIDLSALRVLVADDSSYMRKILRALLQGFGIRAIEEAEDGAEVIEKLPNSVPDIMLLDLHMPILDGLEVLRMVRTPTHPCAYLPIIVVSGFSERHRVLAARNAGAHGYIRKPVSAATLMSQIEKVVMAPRPFIRARTYFGPDRRHFSGPVPEDGDRRGAKSKKHGP